MKKVALIFDKDEFEGITIIKMFYFTQNFVVL